MSLPVYDRNRGQVASEPQYGERRLRFLYDTLPGRILLKTIIARPWYSEISAAYDRSSLSAGKISPFIDQYKVDMSEYPQTSFRSFDDFITRQIDPAKRPIATGPGALIAVADAKLLVYDITQDGVIPVKHSAYTVAELLCDQTLAGSYSGGTCLVFRLSTDDYHRYCFVDDGQVTGTRVITGLLHTVQPISSKRFKTYVENYRIVSTFDTANFGQIITIEVGALLVGKIHNHDIKPAKRGQEKGYFSLGGSSIVLLFKPGVIDIAADIRKYSADGIETKVHMGEAIGEKVHA